MNNKRTDQEVVDILLFFLRKRENAGREGEQVLWGKIVSEIGRKKRVEKRIRLYRITSVAATFLLLLGFAGYYMKRDVKSSLEQYIGQLQPIVSDSTRQIQIYLSEGDHMEVEERTAHIAYSARGEITLNNKGKEERLKEDSSQKVQKENKLAYDRVVVPKGKFSRLVLSDGSTLDINSGSMVVYPRVFEPGRREIYVEGEVCLHVAKNEKAPFIVKTESFDVEVLGTTFNVNAYKGASRSEVVLVEGSINLSDRHERSVLMKPDRLVAIENGKAGEPEVVKASDYVAWTEGLMILSEEPLGEVFKRLERFYGTRIKVTPDAAKLEMKGKIDLTLPIEELIDLLSKTAPISYVKTMEGGYAISYKKE